MLRTEPTAVDLGLCTAPDAATAAAAASARAASALPAAPPAEPAASGGVLFSGVLLGLLPAPWIRPRSVPGKAPATPDPYPGPGVLTAAASAAVAVLLPLSAAAAQLALAARPGLAVACAAAAAVAVSSWLPLLWPLSLKDKCGVTGGGSGADRGPLPAPIMLLPAPPRAGGHRGEEGPVILDPAAAALPLPALVVPAVTAAPARERADKPWAVVAGARYGTALHPGSGMRRRCWWLAAARAARMAARTLRSRRCSWPPGQGDPGMTCCTGRGH